MIAHSACIYQSRGRDFVLFSVAPVGRHGFDVGIMLRNRRCLIMRRRQILLAISSILFLIVPYKIFVSDNSFFSISRSSTISTKASFIFSCHNASEAGTVNEHDRIPKIIHQTWKSQDSLPETFRAWMESWLLLNANWEYWFWTDSDMRSFMQAVYPQFLSLYDSYPTQGYRADAFR
jgi:hypothetical protein